jgi:cytoskeletal protein RodZ
MNAGSNSTEVDKLEGLIREANREIESIADSSHDLSLNLALKRAQVNSEETVSFNRRRDSRVAIQVGAIAVLLGFVASLVGFWLWYKKLQRFQDRVVAKEAEDKLAPAVANKQIEQAPPPANPGNSLEPVK